MASAPQLEITQPMPETSTNSQTPRFKGTTTDPLDPVIIMIYPGDGVQGFPFSTATVALPVSGLEEGEWEVAPEEPLDAGRYTAVAEQTDLLETGESAAVTFTVDTTPPAVSIGSQPSRTKDPTPTLSGAAGDAPGDDPTITVRIYDGDLPEGTEAESGSVTRSGATWSYTPSGPLAEGTYTVQATQEDEAGNVGRSSAVTFVVDTTPPALTLSTPALGEQLKVSQATFSGLAGHASGDEKKVTLTVYEGEVAIDSIEVIPEASGKWTTGSTAPRLVSGIYKAVAIQRDEAGNETEKTVMFSIDANAPDVTLAPAGFVRRGGQLLTGPTPSFSGTGASEPVDSGSVVIKVYAGDTASATATALRSVAAPLSGSEWSTGPLEALPDGTYTVQAEQEDSSSQTGVSEAVTFTVDANPPAVT
ncbi:MAG: Ig-like domain-containing protein, partial [Solirubrobacteraceae bacterium]